MNVGFTQHSYGCVNTVTFPLWKKKVKKKIKTTKWKRKIKVKKKFARIVCYVFLYVSDECKSLKLHEKKKSKVSACTCHK